MMPCVQECVVLASLRPEGAVGLLQSQDVVCLQLGVILFLLKLSNQIWVDRPQPEPVVHCSSN